MKFITPIISVVIPVYNRAHCIERAITSVQIQNFDELEIIVVDDGSSDNSVEEIKKLANSDDRIRVIQHDKNKGEAAARNTGVKSAKGDYIAFLDSDDEWLEGKLIKQFQLLSDSPEFIGACCTGQYVVDENNNETVIKDWTETLPITDKNLLVKGCGVGMGTTFLIRKQVFNNTGFYDESLPLLVDLDWLCRLTAKYSVVKISEPLIKYYKAPMRSGQKMEEAVEFFTLKNKEYLSEFSFATRLKIKSQFLNYISLAYFVHGPWRFFMKTRFIHLLYNPMQHPWTYIHFLYTGIGLLSVGKKNNGENHGY